MVRFEKWMLEEADRLIKKFTKKRDVTYFESYIIIYNLIVMKIIVVQTIIQFGNN